MNTGRNTSFWQKSITLHLAVFHHVLVQIIDPGDLDGWGELESGDRKTVLSLIEQHQEVNIIYKTDKLTIVKKTTVSKTSVSVEQKCDVWCH